MCDAVLKHAKDVDVAIFAAAVSDWRPAKQLPQKAKKESGGERQSIELVQNPESALESLKVMPKAAVRVGFAAETQEHLVNAEAKRHAKKFDLMVANDVSRPGSGFESDENEAWLLTEGTEPRELGPVPKTELARMILDVVEELLAARAAKPRRR